MAQSWLTDPVCGPGRRPGPPPGEPRSCCATPPSGCDPQVPAAARQDLLRPRVRAVPGRRRQRRHRRIVPRRERARDGARSPLSGPRTTCGRWTRDATRASPTTPAPYACLRTRAHGRRSSLFTACPRAGPAWRHAQPFERLQVAQRREVRGRVAAEVQAPQRAEVRQRAHVRDTVAALIEPFAAGTRSHSSGSRSPSGERSAAGLPPTSRRRSDHRSDSGAKSANALPDRSRLARPQRSAVSVADGLHAVAPRGQPARPANDRPASNCYVGANHRFRGRRPSSES